MENHAIYLRAVGILLSAAMAFLLVSANASASDPAAAPPLPSFSGSGANALSSSKKIPESGQANRAKSEVDFRKELLPRVDELVRKALRSCPALKLKLSDELRSKILKAVGQALDEGVEYIPTSAKRPMDGDGPKKTPPATKPVKGVLLADNKVFYIRIDIFSAAAVADLAETLKGVFRQAVKPLGMVVDIRGTASGTSQDAVSAVGLFAPARELPSLEGVQYAGRISAAPVVILTDKGTKGPAELFASLMKSHDGAVLIGEDTAGALFPKTLVALAQGDALMVPRIPLGLEDVPRGKVRAAIKCPADRIPFKDIQKNRDAYKKDSCLMRAVEIVICVDALSPQ